jgi:RND superfamily putative drug exporter
LQAARWSASHPWRAIGAWFAFVAIAVALAALVPTRQTDDADYRIGESGRADAMAAAGHFADDQIETILLTARDGGSPSDASVAQVAAALRSELSGAHGVTQVTGARWNAAHTAALVDVHLRSTVDDASQVQAATARIARAHAELRVREAGDVSVNTAINDRVAQDLHSAEGISLPITILLMLLAFGALVAAGVPVLLAITSVAATMGIAAPLSHLIHAEPTVTSMIVLFGMAVGVDYSLFYLRRAREERARGAANRDAILVAAATSGRAVAISGLTVIAAMSGMFLSGNTIFEGFAIGTILVVASAVVGSLIAVPAALSLFGDWADRPRIPLLGRYRRADRESRVWRAILDRVLARPVVAMVLAGGALVALALPALQLDTRLLSDNDLPRSIPIMRTYDDAQRHFPAEGYEHEVVVRASDVRAPAVASAIGDLVARAQASGAFVADAEPSVEVSADGTVATIDLPYAGPPEGATASRGLDLLRDEIVPATVGRVGEEALVTGDAAGGRDFNDRMAERLPIVFGFVLLLTFALLLLTFRSLVVSATAILLNLLSVLAAYGLLVLVFQHSWAEGLLGFESNGAIVAWLPLFLFVILFGLSMDYHVFVLSRIREGVDRGMTTEDAVSWGIRSSAGVVTSAAVVMMGVFAIFATLTTLDMKQLGIGLAAAVLIDATVVRGVLLPAAMRVLGTRNWYLPRALRWLPTVAHEVPAGAPRPANALVS